MASCRWVVNGALRKLGRLGAGREPRTADATDALAALQGLYGSWIASGAFGRLTDIIAQVDMTAGEGQRIIRDPDVATITLPEYVPAFTVPLPYGALWPAVVQNGADTANRPPRDGAVIQLVDSVQGGVATFIYDGTLKVWSQIELLQLDSEAPRSVPDPEGLSACLAIELGDTFGAEIGPTTARQAARYQSALCNNLSMPRRAAVGVYV
jgi:hypothetical protein